MYKIFVLGVLVHQAMAGQGQAVIQEGSGQDIPYAYTPDEIIVKFHKKAAKNDSGGREHEMNYDFYHFVGDGIINGLDLRVL